MREREIACQFYEYEGVCSKGGRGTFRDSCQTCKKYRPVKNGKPARKDLRKQKKEKIDRRDMKEMIRDY